MRLLGRRLPIAGRKQRGMIDGHQSAPLSLSFSSVVAAGSKGLSFSLVFPPGVIPALMAFCSRSPVGPFDSVAVTFPL